MLLCSQTLAVPTKIVAFQGSELKKFRSDGIFQGFGCLLECSFFQTCKLWTAQQLTSETLDNSYWAMLPQHSLCIRHPCLGQVHQRSYSLRALGSAAAIAAAHQVAQWAQGNAQVNLQSHCRLWRKQSRALRCPMQTHPP